MHSGTVSSAELFMQCWLWFWPNICILDLSEPLETLLPVCQRIWCLKNCLGLGSLTQMDVPKHINTLVFMSNTFSKARLIHLPICKSMKCFYKNVLQKLIWCKSQRCIHFQATLLFAIASVAAIISSVIHSSEVFEPFAVFVCVLCLCGARDTQRVRQWIFSVVRKHSNHVMTLQIPPTWSEN